MHTADKREIMLEKSEEWETERWWIKPEAIGVTTFVKYEKTGKASHGGAHYLKV